MKKLTFVLLIALVVITFAFSATHDPWDGTGWDVASPDIDQPIGNHYKELYDLRKGVAVRMNKEHVNLAASSVGGEHVPGGAAILFYGDTTAVDANVTAETFVHDGLIYDTTLLQFFTMNATGDAKVGITIGTAGIADANITTAKIADANITTVKLAAMTSQALSPVGSVISFAGSEAPAGWLLCDGTAYSRTTYSALFAVTGTAYGNGNGSTTFNVPDLRGRVSVGLDATDENLAAADALGEAGGEETHTLSVAEIPPHSHQVYTPGISGSGIVLGYGANWADGYIGNTGGGGSHNNLQPYLTFNAIIKY